ncbi:carboxylesterase [Agrilactobacillus composti DSM 18527 = JCM 14202]|uniref:Carboxylesterase n=1 Tax=Agrilactobacillus composti DSM 18527 = JCM 14202 TaxID=1423734 RepID=X0PE10_9LACO|nr:alpha/beta hydrolase [Agrilactobacillus composti]KRM35785.1 carboxylesterase [Agrilactobacillus composti DSM 18527 = JCM 14202]GAF39649.1 carboxylesterase [Agrilactobacillus composti DSM 18527 = JCM 14202]
MTNYENYTFVQGEADVAPLLLLHGTGGDEQDLIPLGHFLSPQASLLAIRGRIVEQGANRYFKHTATGGFDLKNLESETTWLIETLQELASQHKLDLNRLIVMGYSNGANVAAKFILDGKVPIKTGIFFHPMILTPDDATTDLSDSAIWMSHGSLDPIVTEANFKALATAFTSKHAKVETYEAKQSHNLSENELQAAKDWLAQSGRLR